MEELWILGWTVIPFQLKSPLQLPSGSIKSHYYGWRKKFTTYKSCLPNKSDCYFLQIWTHKGRVKKNSHGVKCWIKKTRMSADNLQKVESHLDIWRNFWKANFFLGINLLLARFFCCRWLSIEDNQWSVITIIALLWLADCLFPPGDEREMQRWRKSLLLLNWRQKPKWEIGLFLTSSPCIIHKEGDISCGTFGKSLIYLGLPLANVKLDKENWIDGLPKRSEDHPVAFNIYLDNLSRQNLIEKRFIKCNIRGIWKAAKKYSFLGLCPKHPPTV